MTSDNRWTALSAVAAAASGVVCAIVGRKANKDRTPELHERVALLERDRDILKKACEDLAKIVESIESEGLPEKGALLERRMAEDEEKSDG